VTTTPTQHENGAGVSEAVFPVASYREAAVHLRRPFTAEAVKFKVQATWPKANPTGGLIVAYIDARLVVERLNLIVPHLWSDQYRTVGGGQMWCDLTVDQITRSDVGEGQGKGLVSDALKRAAVKFGVGVSLYATPKMILDVKSGLLKPRKDSLELTPKGEAHLRKMYGQWLDSAGTHAFGAPLDHGDVEDAQGDTEADPVAGVAADAPQAPTTPPPAPKPISMAQATGHAPPISEAQARELYDAATKVVNGDILQRAVAHLAGVDPGDMSTRALSVGRMVAVLDADTALRLAKWINDKAKREETPDAS
jgi:hypothetical protein